MTENEKLDLILAEMQGMKTDIQDIKSEMRDMKSEVQDMKSEMQDMKTDIQDVRKKTTNIELTLENEIRVNIRRVAEGHLDLSRNLHDAMRIDSEKEMLSIRVNMLESELRRIKERLGQVAAV